MARACSDKYGEREIEPVGQEGSVRYKVTVNFEGPVNAEAASGERRTVQIDGSGEPPESSEIWRIHARIVWPASEEGRPEQADLEIEGPMGGRLRGALREGAITTITDAGGESQASRLNLGFDVDESSGGFAGSRGTVQLTGTLEWQGFRLSAGLDLDAPQGAWRPPNASILGARDLAAGASPIGSQALSQETAERDSEDSVRRRRTEEATQPEDRTRPED